MCITSGCDYLSSLPGIGLGKAKNFWQKVSNPDLRTVLRKLPVYLKMPQLVVTQDYIEKFMRANNTFLYQLVYDPQRRVERPLTDYPQSLDLNNLHYCGSKSEPDIAEQMALGNVNIHTKVQVDNVRGAGGTQSSVTTEEEDEVVRALQTGESSRTG